MPFRNSSSWIVSSLDKFTPGRLGRSWSGGWGGARHEEPEPISLLRLYKIAHVALYFGIFGPWGFLATFMCDASMGRRDSNLCISKSDPLNFIPPEQELGVDREPETFVRSAARASLIRDAQVRVLPPGLRVLANSDSVMQRFESRRPNQPVRL